MIIHNIYIVNFFVDCWSIDWFQVISGKIGRFQAGVVPQNIRWKVCGTSPQPMGLIWKNWCQAATRDIPATFKCRPSSFTTRPFQQLSRGTTLITMVIKTCSTWNLPPHKKHDYVFSPCADKTRLFWRQTFRGKLLYIYTYKAQRPRVP